MVSSAKDEGFALRMHPLDLAHLNEQTLGDPLLQRELLHLFAAQSPGLLAQMQALGDTIAEDHHRKALSDLAHRLKGSARAIGANEVATACTPFEGRAACDDDLAVLAAALTAAIEAINLHLDARERPVSASDPAPAGLARS